MGGNIERFFFENLSLFHIAMKSGKLLGHLKNPSWFA